MAQWGPSRRPAIRVPETLEACSLEVSWLGPFLLSSMADGGGGRGVFSHVVFSEVSCCS